MRPLRYRMTEHLPNQIGRSLCRNFAFSETPCSSWGCGRNPGPEGGQEGTPSARSNAEWCTYIENGSWRQVLRRSRGLGRPTNAVFATFHCVVENTFFATSRAVLPRFFRCRAWLSKAGLRVADETFGRGLPASNAPLKPHPVRTWEIFEH